MSAQIILASASPRRQELLQQIGVRFQQKVAAVDETMCENESPEEYVVRLALEKARAVRRRYDNQGLPVLGADTAVVIDGQPLGKPQNRQDCGLMLRRLSGRSHQVLSAVALVAGREEIRVSVSNVWFRLISDAEIEAYWSSSEPCDKAGSYGIQGMAAIFIERLEGSYSGVMGLPLFETAHLLEDFDIRVLGHKQ